MNGTRRAPAKVNLGLLVGPRDDAGYHEIFTVFAPIDVYDELEFSLEAEDANGRPGALQVECSAAPGETNLAARALRALESHTGWTLSGRVAISKGIPVGAGLGGGSSDAAMALLAGAQALAEAGGPVPGRSELVGLARKLGADVAFFLDPAPAIGRGVGEILEPLALPQLWLVLVVFDRMLSTARVYRSLDVVRPAVSKAYFEHRADQAERRWRRVEDPAQAGRLLENDLEQAGFALVPSLADDKEALIREGALGALMSGSGPTLFGLCESVAAAQELARRLDARGLQTRVATVVNTPAGLTPSGG
ncbi:MAG: 4-(cytidine 5'-diphospho)-2-C-methyl-D-erythritol kinase [Actinomycetia bacterium]|nr:4-(cytidine 5'-diphospho)-2-C-methyl-D-erythritol kinase [Actinomycetes bacterium]